MKKVDQGLMMLEILLLE